MRVLCIGQNFPGELDPLARELAKSPDNAVFMACLRQKRNVSLPNVRRIILKKCNSARFDRSYLGCWSLALNTAKNAADAYMAAPRTDFYPDIILACASNGIAFPLPQIFPKAFMVSYADTKLADFPICGPGLYEARRICQETQFMQSALGFIRYPEQAAQFSFAGPARPRLLPPMADAAFFAPAQGEIAAYGDFPKGAELIAILSGALRERPLRIFWSQLAELLQARPGCHICLLAEGGLQGWRWEEFAEKLPEKSRKRLRLEYAPDNGEYRAILHAASLILCLNADYTVGQRLLEAMSCEKLLLVGLNNLSFLKPGRDCLDFGMFSKQSLMDMAASCFSGRQTRELAAIKHNARQKVLAEFDQEKILPGHLEFLLGELGKRKAAGQSNFL